MWNFLINDCWIRQKFLEWSDPCPETQTGQVFFHMWNLDLKFRCACLHGVPADESEL